MQKTTKVLTQENKTNSCLNAFILSNFNYCPVVWHNCGLIYTRKIEKIQERGLRFVYNNFISPYSELLSRLGKRLLFVERIRTIATEAYKIVIKIGPALLHGNITTKESNLRDRSVRAVQPNVRTFKYGLNSFRYNGAKIWNLLPINNKCTATYKHFKYLTCNWDGPECACGACILCV